MLPEAAPPAPTANSLREFEKNAVIRRMFKKWPKCHLHILVYINPHSTQVSFTVFSGIPSDLLTLPGFSSFK